MDSMQRASRQHMNVVDSALGQRVTKIATEALSHVMATTYPTRDAAAKAWAAIIQPLTNQYRVEIGSKLFSMTGAPNGPTRVGSPTSDGEMCRISYQCGVNVTLGGDVSGGILSGDIHSHPINVSFSQRDLSTADYMHKSSRSLIEFTAYVSLPNGKLYKWSTLAIQNNYQKSWKAYLEHTVHEVK